MLFYFFSEQPWAISYILSFLIEAERKDPPEGWGAKATMLNLVGQRALMAVSMHGSPCQNDSKVFKSHIKAYKALVENRSLTAIYPCGTCHLE